MYLIRMRIKSDRVLGDTMDRTYWVDSGDLLLGETVVSQQSGLRLYDGEDRTSFDSGVLRLTTHRLIWDDDEQEGRTLALDLCLVTKTEHVPGTFTKSPKIAVHLVPAPESKPPGPCALQKANFIRLSFRKGGQEEFHRLLKQRLSDKEWEKKLPPAPSKSGGLRLRAGIVGIERNIEKKQQQTGQQVSQAFKDLDALINKAKDMVSLVNKFAAKVEEKKGALSEDETVQFKAYLLSVGIANPVTKDTHGSGSNYHKELSKQLASFLDAPLKETGGIMTLADVYCRFNRARGMELVSPEDLVNACNLFESLRLPLRVRKFESGVLVVQSLTHDESSFITHTLDMLEREGSLSAEELSGLAKVSITLATERLLITEKAGKACRDDSVEGLRFYPNRFLTEVS